MSWLSIGSGALGAVGLAVAAALYFWGSRWKERAEGRLKLAKTEAKAWAIESEKRRAAEARLETVIAQLKADIARTEEALVTCETPAASREHLRALSRRLSEAAVRRAD